MGKISGSVTGSSGAVSGAQIVVTGVAAGLNVSAGAVTDGNGNYSTIPLPAGTYSVTASSGTLSATVNNAVVNNDGNTTVNVSLGSSPPPPTVSVTVTTSPSGLTIAADGVTFTAPHTFSWAPSSGHTIAVTTPQNASASAQLVWANWSDGGGISHGIFAPASGTATYTAAFTQQYFLTMTAGSGGTVSPSSGFFNAGQAVGISATPSSGESFSAWAGSGTGSFTGSTASASVTMNGPISETASFQGSSPAPDFSLSVTPGSQTVTAGGATSYTVTVIGSGGFAGAVNLVASGLPSGVSGGFNPSAITGSGTSTLTVNTGSGTPVGGYTLTVTGSSSSLSHSGSASLTVTAGGPPQPPSTVSVSPSSGSGTGQAFTFTFTDPSGGANIAAAQMDVNASLTAASACYLYFGNSSRTIQLAGDSGSFAGAAVIGSPGTLQNSQCAVDAGASSVTVSGNTLTLTLALSFKTAFAGAKNVYMEVQNSSFDSGWALRGTYTVTGSSATPNFSLSVSPGSQTIAAGGTTSYTVTVLGSGGFAGSVNLGVSGLPSGASGGFNPAAITGSGTSTLIVNTSSATPAGGYTVIVTGSGGGLTHTGSASLTITSAATPQPPSTVSVSPSGASGTGQTFSFTFSDPNGGGNISSTQMDINASLAAANACYFYYSRGSNALQLASDSGSFGSPATIGATGSLQNSQCSVDTGASSVSVSGTNLTVNLAISFKAAFVGAKYIYMEAQNASFDSGWAIRGSYGVTGGSGGGGGGGVTPQPPSTVSVSPSSASGTSQTFAFTFSDPNGGGNITSAQMDINASLTAANGCYFYYSRAANVLQLANDSGSFGSPTTIGVPGTQQNSQCSVDTGASSATVSGTNLTVNLAISFKAAFVGAKGIYMEAQNAAFDSGWAFRGTYSVTGGSSGGGGVTPQPPSTVSAAPSGGIGATQIFSLVFSDPAGGVNISSAQIDINASLTAANACYFYYSRPGNTIQLANNAGSFGATSTLGIPGTQQNSQCILDAGASSVSIAGNTLTLTLAITFKQPAYSGTKNIYMEAQNPSFDSGWALRGQWTIP
jgi:hypothetical protein